MTAGKGTQGVRERIRETYTAAFQAKVGLAAIRGMKTANESGQGCGPHPVPASQWKQEILAQAGSLFETRRGRQKVEDAADAERLDREIGRLNCPGLGVH